MSQFTTYRCPKCAAVFRLDSRIKGKKVSCPKCKFHTLIPDFDVSVSASNSNPNLSSVVKAAPSMLTPPPIPTRSQDENDIELKGETEYFGVSRNVFGFFLAICAIAQVPVLDFLKPYLGWPIMVWWALICWLLLILAAFSKYISKKTSRGISIRSFAEVVSSNWKVTKSKCFFCGVITALVIVEAFFPVNGIMASFLPTVFNMQIKFMEQIPQEAVGFGESKEIAENDALRSAVKQRFGVLIDSKTVIESGKLQQDYIKLNTIGSVPSYEVTGVRKIDSKTYEVTIRARVEFAKNQLNISK